MLYTVPAGEAHSLCIFLNNVTAHGMQKQISEPCVLHPQGSILPGYEHVSGSNVHLILVLCYRGHGHCWDDLQVP